MVQSSRFLLGRFRLDVWWYGVPLLLRGSLAFGETPWSRRCVWLAEVFGVF